MRINCSVSQPDAFFAEATCQIQDQYSLPNDVWNSACSNPFLGTSFSSHRSI